MELGGGGGLPHGEGGDGEAGRESWEVAEMEGDACWVVERSW